MAVVKQIKQQEVLKMATLIVSMSEDLKEKFQALCTSREISMSAQVIKYLSQEVNESAVDTRYYVFVPEKCTCLLCGFVWTPKKKDPSACPACKSYRWNDPIALKERNARDLKRLAVDSDTTIAEREAKRLIREQKRLFKELWSEYERIGRLCEFKSTKAIAEKIGTTAEKLLLYLDGNMPVKQAQIDHMKSILS